MAQEDIAEMVDNVLVFKRPVTFDDIYEHTTELIIKMYPQTADLLEALADVTYDDVCIDLREFIIELAQEQGMYVEQTEGKNMRYIVRASKMHKYDSATKPFGYVVYDGNDIKTAKEKMIEYAEYGGVNFESKEE